MAERFLHNDSRAPPAIRFGQVLDNGFEQDRRNCQVVRRAFWLLEFLARCVEGRRILIVAVHVAQQSDQLIERRGIETTMFLQAVFRASTKLIEIPSSFGHANYGDVEVSSFHHRLQGWENLFVGEIAGGTKE